MYDENTKIRECRGCGAVADTEDDFCVQCLQAEVCCASYEAAARANCGCRGYAATALRLLRERE